jgi:hypothetical protein
VEKAFISTPKDGQAGSLECEEHIYHVFFILMGSFTMNLSRRAKLLTSSSTKVSCSVIGRLSGPNIQENGVLVTGYCIMTVPLLTPPFQYNIWPRTTWLWSPTPLYCPDLAPSDYFCFKD